MPSTVCNLLISVCNLLALTCRAPCCTSRRRSEVVTIKLASASRQPPRRSRTRCLVSRTRRCLVSLVGRTHRGGQKAYKQKHASASRTYNMHNTWQGGLAPHTSLIIHTSPTPTALRGATRLVCEAPLAVAGKYFTHSHWHGRKYFPAVIFIAAIRSFHLWSMSAVEMRVFSCWYMRASF